jgi:hypothetical protein
MLIFLILMKYLLKSLNCKKHGSLKRQKTSPIPPVEVIYHFDLFPLSLLPFILFFFFFTMVQLSPWTHGTLAVTAQAPGPFGLPAGALSSWGLNRTIVCLRSRVKNNSFKQEAGFGPEILGPPCEWSSASAWRSPS